MLKMHHGQQLPQKKEKLLLSSSLNWWVSKECSAFFMLEGKKRCLYRRRMRRSLYHCNAPYEGFRIAYYIDVSLAIQKIWLCRYLCTTAGLWKTMQKWFNALITVTLNGSIVSLSGLWKSVTFMYTARLKTSVGQGAIQYQVNPIIN